MSDNYVLPEGFYRRSMKASVLLGMVAAMFTAVYAGWALAGQYFLTLSWMLVNLSLWRRSLGEILGPRRPLALAVFISGKFAWIAVLFGLCRWLGIKNLDSFLAFLLGFNTPFLIIFLRFLGFAITRGLSPLSNVGGKGP